MKYSDKPVPCDGPCGGMFADAVMHRFTVWRGGVESIVGKFCPACCPRCVQPEQSHTVDGNVARSHSVDDADQDPLLRGALWRMFGVMAHG